MTENVKYLAQISYGTPLLTKLFIERETPKFLIIERFERMLNRSYIPPRIRNDKDGLFDNVSDALKYLVSRLDKLITKEQIKIDKMGIDLKELRVVLEKVLIDQRLDDTSLDIYPQDGTSIRNAEEQA